MQTKRRATPSFTTDDALRTAIDRGIYVHGFKVELNCDRDRLNNVHVRRYTCRGTKLGALQSMQYLISDQDIHHMAVQITVAADDLSTDHVCIGRWLCSALRWGSSTPRCA